MRFRVEAMLLMKRRQICLFWWRGTKCKGSKNVMWDSDKVLLKSVEGEAFEEKFVESKALIDMFFSQISKWEPVDYDTKLERRFDVVKRKKSFLQWTFSWISISGRWKLWGLLLRRKIPSSGYSGGIRSNGVESETDLEVIEGAKMKTSELTQDLKNIIPCVWMGNVEGAKVENEGVNKNLALGLVGWQIVKTCGHPRGLDWCLGLYNGAIGSDCYSNR
ncbi:hypothetical protein VNO78_30507 [Psophocarpus tetragonolobus]|uniref:Uncharacterized protein n=1 Tax=Psophocarpus tetragonolobus TaxID=3891 RepID=A0AAN9RY07_PSOTE